MVYSKIQSFGAYFKTVSKSR